LTRKDESARRDDVLLRMLKTPPDARSPNKRDKKIDPGKLEKLMEDPAKNLDEIAREIGNKED
jgi:hypothetical protein